MIPGSNPSPQPFDPPSATPQANDAPTEAAAEGPSLEEVVRQTLDAQSGEEGLAPEVHAALVEVGRRHAADQALEPPIVQQLIDVVLACRFERLRQQPEARAEVSQRIAYVLWEDTPSRERLERLWKHLLEEPR